MERFQATMPIVLLAILISTNAAAEYPAECLGIDTPSAPFCGSYTEPGCCDDQGRVVWCEAGELYCIDCPSQDTTCGWLAEKGFYDCEQTGGDPSGTYPQNCLASCSPPCPSGQYCVQGQCMGTPSGCAGSLFPIGSDCGAVTMEGCCNTQGMVLWCELGNLHCIDCISVENPTCGWNAEGSYYDCGTAGSADPAGLYPMTCGSGVGPCTANCIGKVCGDDGCGGSCGSCGAYSSCVTGQCLCEYLPCGGKCCEPSAKCFEGSCCVPSCAGMECGTDGCGGSCGTCPAGYQCLSGQCSNGTHPDPEPDVVSPDVVEQDLTSNDMVRPDNITGNDQIGQDQFSPPPQDSSTQPGTKDTTVFIVPEDQLDSSPAKSTGCSTSAQATPLHALMLLALFLSLFGLRRLGRSHS